MREKAPPYQPEYITLPELDALIAPKFGPPISIPE
jgi:hypothetical protein